jgi:ABC-type Fe3+/spermidine/putrescine transport system ATPase subunit
MAPDDEQQKAKPFLEIENISKRYGDNTAVDHVTIPIHRGEIISLLGPSGCGKSTLLKILAGLEELDSGTVSFEGKSLKNVPPEARNFGLMPQDLVLFPHLNVWDNIAFGLRMQRQSDITIRSRVNDLLTLVGLPDQGTRSVHELSGGEQQRVALARSLAPEPKLLMLDEPMGALDRRLREDLYLQLKAILKEVGVTAIYVTHDHDEAFAVSDRAVIMKDGKFIQIGAPEELYTAPSNAFIARFLGFQNLFPAKLYPQADIINVETPIGVFEISADQVQGSSKVVEGTLLLPDQSVLMQNLDKPNAGARPLSGVIESKIFQQGYYRIYVSLDPGLLRLSVPMTTDSAKLVLGDNLNLEVDSTKLMVLPSEY